MRIGIYSGAFDPIHKGHIQVAKLALTACDEVLIMPDYISGYYKKMADYNDRIDMCLLATDWLEETISWSRLGMDLKCTGKTYDNMIKIQSRYKEFGVGDEKLHFIAGGDTAKFKVHKWYKSEKLRNEFPFIVVSRPSATDGSEVSHKWYYDEPHVYLRNTEHINYSSTYIRLAIKNKEFEKAAKYLDENVFKFIIDKGLYQ